MELRQRLPSREADPRTDGDPFERWPISPYFSIGLTGPLLGATEAIFDQVSAGVHKRGVSYFDFARQTESAVVIERIAEARMRIDSAWLHVLRSARELDEKTKLGPLDYTTRARMRADAAFAVSELRTAADALLTIAGASGFAEASPIQRSWRDLNVGSRHAFLNTNAVFEAYGRAYCGVEPNITSWI